MSQKNLLKFFTLSLLTLFALPGCDKGSQTTASQFIKSTKEGIEKIIENDQKKPEEKPNTPSSAPPSPDTKTKVDDSTTTASEKPRNPFSLKQESETDQRDNVLTKIFNGKLTLIGIMTENNKKWAIIRAADGKLFIVTQGSKLGKTIVKVTEVSKSGVTIETSDGTETRTYKLNLEEPKRE